MGTTDLEINGGPGSAAQRWVRTRLEQFPVLYRIARRAYRQVRRRPAFHFEREPTVHLAQPEGADAAKVRNLLAYTKTSGTDYAAQDFPAGYHTIVLNGDRLEGQRDPEFRLRLLPFDLRGLSVLDIGSNQGGMLFAAARHGISWGVGIDLDYRMVNAATRIRRVEGHSGLDFFVHDLEKDSLSLLDDYLPEHKVDLVFLLSVCMWIENWRDVIDWARSRSRMMLFESNGLPAQQRAQIGYLRTRFSEVRELSESNRSDDAVPRRLFICTNEVEPLQR